MLQREKSFDILYGMGKKIALFFVAVVLCCFSASSFFTPKASALTVSSRSVQLSSSSNAGSAATTSYLINFTIPTGTAMSTLKGIVLDFCSNSPIIGDTTCSGTVGTNVPNLSATPSVTTAGVLTASGWTAGMLNSNRTLTLINATGVAVTGGSSVVTFTIANVQNPTATPATFYARAYTYSSTAGATGYLVANPDTGGAHSDDGGVALATASQITVTAKVQETITFCVYTSGANCAGGSVAGMILGDSFGVLSSRTTAYLTSTNATTPLTAKLGIASNTTTGVTVRAKASGTLTSGANTIAATGSGAGTCTADSTTASVEQFGLSATAGAGQTVDAGYACTAGNHSFDSTNLITTYGDPIVTTAGPTTEAATTVDFEGKSSTTTKSGVYAATFTFIATGVY